MDGWKRVAAVVGLVLMAPLLVVFLVSGLVMPSWTVVLFVLVWVALLVLALYQFKRNPVVVLLVPFTGFVFWLAFWIVGSMLFHWTA